MITTNQFVLGCARFSGKYGVNSKFHINVKSLKKIFLNNRKYIKEIDTAIGYKKANKKLKNINLKKFRVSSKIPRLNLSDKKLEFNTIKKIKDHAELLKIKKFEILYLHDPCQILKRNGFKILQILNSIKKAKLTKKIGISIYNPKELKLLLSKFKPDVVQIPLNIFDRRFLKNNILNILKRKKISIYLRSLFLQGVLLRDYKTLPKYFQRWEKLFKSWEFWVKKKKLKKLEACMSILNIVPNKIKIIIGVENDNQLKEIFNSIKIKSYPPTNIFSNNSKLINPSKWSIKK
jgi:aryl-alcohol dehydrogenase-like predicted oxidoreductase